REPWRGAGGGRQSVVVRERSRARRASRGGRSGAQRRVCRGTAVGAHRLPQLRSSRRPGRDGRPRGDDRRSRGRGGSPRRARGAPPSLDLAREARLQELAVLAAEGRWVRAAHDVSDGGLAVALAEMLIAGPSDNALGIELNVAAFETRLALVLFSERPGIVFEV